MDNKVNVSAWIQCMEMSGSAVYVALSETHELKNKYKNMR